MRHRYETSSNSVTVVHGFHELFFKLIHVVLRGFLVWIDFNGYIFDVATVFSEPGLSDSS
jgi:hypothetical protein